MPEAVQDRKGQPGHCQAVGREFQLEPAEPAVTGVHYTVVHQPTGWGDPEPVTHPVSCFQMGN